MKITQTFKFERDCKHSVRYQPETDTPENPAIASCIYVDRRVLPRGIAEPRVQITLEIATVVDPRLEALKA